MNGFALRGAAAANDTCFPSRKKKKTRKNLIYMAVAATFPNFLCNVLWSRVAICGIQAKSNSSFKHFYLIEFTQLTWETKAHKVHPETVRAQRVAGPTDKTVFILGCFQQNLHFEPGHALTD